MMKRLFATLTLCTLGAFSLAAAAPRHESPAPPAEASEANLPPRFPDAVTHHTLVMGGHTYAYTARAGTLDVTNPAGKIGCRMFYTAFTLDDANASQRPVTFIYNGGPGSSTVWLRMGSMGPVRVVVADGGMTGPAPYRIVDNQYSLLDRTDEVFVDMCASGYSRLIGDGKPKDFFTADNDVRSFAKFVDRYLTKFGRWNSPKFLWGESYGTPRSAMLVNVLQNEGIGINGVILQSSILNFALYASTYGNSVPQAGGDWSYVLYLPTETATAWYHHRMPGAPADLQTAVQESRDFAMGEYLNALAMGSRLPRSTYDDVVAKLHRFTGLSEQFIRNADLRVPYQTFLVQLERNEGIEVGRYDSRYQSDMLDSVESYFPWDPTDAAIDSAFTASNNEYIQNVLGYRPPMTYRILAYSLIRSEGGWDFSHNGEPTLNTAPDLANAMTFNPDLKVFSANGYYDFATPWLATVYTLEHLNLKPALEANITYGFYPSGHMIYLNHDSLVQYHDDLENWYANALAGR
jgi:carboxypeptidase C (cathepsin A)